MPETRSRVVDHHRVLEVARRQFVADGTVDMQRLADELAVSRATLYRIVSSRERLAAEVLWSLAEISLQRATDEMTGALDLDQLLQIGAKFRNAALRAEALKTFMRTDPSTAAVALFTPSSMRDRVAKGWRRLLDEAVQETGMTLTIDAAQAADIIVSLGASTLFADLVANQPDETDLVAVVLRSLFFDAT